MDLIDGLGRRAGLAIASLLLGAALVLGFKAPTDASPDTTADAGTGATGTGSSGAGTSGTPGAGTSRATASPRAGSGSTGSSGGTSQAKGTGTVTGSLVSTRYGPVEVQVTVANGKITDISPVALPTGGRSGAISQYAAPILGSEALAAQSANIDLVSGATYTSRGYEQSLQSALDQAGL